MQRLIVQPRDDDSASGQTENVTGALGAEHPGTRQEGHGCSVGYGRPPQGSRFKPGCSGNPKGRPRGDVAFKTLLKRELEERVAVKEQGHRRKLSKRGVIVKRLVSEAMAGSPKHLAIVLAQDPIAAEVLDGVTAALSRPADAAVKADLIRRLRAAAEMADEGNATDDPETVRSKGST